MNSWSCFPVLSFDKRDDIFPLEAVMKDLKLVFFSCTLEVLSGQRWSCADTAFPHPQGSSSNLLWALCLALVLAYLAAISAEGGDR